jgi:RND family efflux transporter MFP subunit
MSNRIFNLLWQRRSGKIALIVCVATAIFVVFFPRKDADRIDPDNAHFCHVERGDLVVSILQTGELKAKSSRDILNKAYRDAKIVYVVEDGSVVTNGQLLVELESSQLLEKYLDQRSDVANADADLLHAQEALEIAKLKNATDLESAALAVDLAKLDLKKYTEAEYPQMVLKAESGIKLAQQELKKARSELEGTQELYEKGFSNRQELESDQLNVDRKDIEVQNKTKDLEILQKYTYVKTLKELKNKVATTESALERLKKTIASDTLGKKASIESKKTRLEIERNQLETREEQLENTKVYADFDGQVFYPNNRRGPKIEEGANLNFRQQILSFPDLTAWDIKVAIPEAMIDKVAVGQEVVASLDAVPGVLLHGRVEKISAVPDSQNWFNSGVKTYTIIIDIFDQPGVPLKPGMSATVEIVTDRLHDVLYVPIQSVVSKGDQHFVYMARHGRKVLRPVQMGKYNTRSIEIIQGLEEGDQLLLYAEVELESDTRFKRSPLAKESQKKGKQEKK